MIRTWKRASQLLLCLVSLSCDGDSPFVDDPPKNPLPGGQIEVPGCGYSIVTRDGATAPVPGTAMLGKDPTPFGVHLGLRGDPKTSINVIWRTKDEETLATQIRFNKGPLGSAKEETRDGFTFVYETPNRDPVRIHEVHLCGLNPGTLYTYRVGGVGADGKEVWSPAYTFRTAPDLQAQPDAQVVLGVLGDTRGAHATWGEIAWQMQKVGSPDLILFTGDAVTLGSLQYEWDTFFGQAESVLATVPMVFAHGNHELNAVEYYSQLAMPGDEENFGFSYGAARITVLNDSPSTSSDLVDKVRPFLEADLKASQDPFRLVLHHRGLWSAALVHGGDSELRGLLGPVIDQYKVDLVLNGHDHNYERSKPLRGTTPMVGPMDGTIYVVAGSAGAELYDNGSLFHTEKSEKTHNFVILKVRRRVLELRAYRADGSNLDSFTTMK